MPLLTILSDGEKQQFETPPLFTGEERKYFFTVPKWVEEILSTLRTPESKVGFVLQLGYFRASKMFFAKQTFHQKDIAFATRRVNITECDVQNYDKTTLLRHRKLILEKLGYEEFTPAIAGMLSQEVDFLLSKQIRLKEIFGSLLEVLEEKRVEIPNYNTLAVLITDGFRAYEKRLLTAIEKNLGAEDKQLLDSLLAVDQAYQINDKQDLKLKRYVITLLKRPRQSTRPAKIKENIHDLLVLKEMFERLQPALDILALSTEMIWHYAMIVIKARISQLPRQDEKRYLYLLCFITHQYCTLQDLLIDTFLKVAQKAANTAKDAQRTTYFEKRTDRSKATVVLTGVVENAETFKQKVTQIVLAEHLTPEQKLSKLEALVKQAAVSSIGNAQEALALLKGDTKRMERDADFYDALQSQSLWLQTRTTEIVKLLVFNEETSRKNIIEAINHFVQKGGNIGEHPPIAFLNKKEQQIVLDSHKRIRVSLYKILFFQHIADSIKSGGLNLKYSYRYRSLDEYMIAKESWKKNKSEYLKRAKLEQFIDFPAVIQDLKEKLDKQYTTTNNHILAETNQYITIHGDHQFTLTTPRQEETNESTVDLFPQARFISLCEVLATIQGVTGFLNAFSHIQLTHVREKPVDKVFFAGIMGLGCNIGISKFAQIAKHINQATLERTVNYYFLPGTVSDANDKIIAFMDTLPLARIFDRKDGLRITTSDGQKYPVHGESLLARRSYKYFGKDQGITAYTFRDNRDFLYHSTVFSPTDREAMYVIDGMQHNEVVESDMHAVDSHGVTPLTFAVTHFLGVFLAPRIKSMDTKQRYAFVRRKAYQEKGYPILPDQLIDTDIIQEQWDEILRFIVTIKLKKTPASQLFQRLNSYSHLHPLYKALKQFGDIIQTIFILRDIDEPDIRQTGEKELNKLEHTNKFAKAVFHGNNQEFHQETREEQLIAEGCKRLIENTIICWNYLYLSEKVANTPEEKQREELLHQIKYSSMASWQHINLLGEYDFSDKRVNGITQFHLSKILSLIIS